MQRHESRADAAGPFPVLALRHVEFRMARPVADRSLVAKGNRGNMVECGLARNATARLSDDDRNLTFIVKLIAFRWPDQWLAMTGEATRKARKREGRICCAWPSLYSAFLSG